MEFQPTAPKGAVKITFVEGSLSKFTGSELHIAYGEKKPLTRRKFVLFARKVVNFAKANKIKNIVVDFKDLRALAPKSWSDEEVGKVAATAFVMADYEHVIYKSKPKDGWNFIEKVGVTNTPEKAKKGGFWIGEQIAAAVNECRELANTPGSDMTPKHLAEATRRLVKSSGAGAKIKVKVLGRKEMEKLGMGAVLGVAKGSSEEPQFIVVEYWGAKNKKEKPVVMVGKGVTFDTGGLNIKTGDHMYEMHMDMSGGAAVICAIALAARLKVPANVVALVPAVENSPAQGAMRPGDMLKSLSGKTIEVLNTDAEGRIILADGVTYAKRYDPALVVDVATLTGAALIAMGQQASCYMTNDEGKIDEYQALAEQSGDYMWPLPAWEEYEDMTKGAFGDVPNISTAGNSRYGGVIAGGMFIKRFADELKCPWLHIDMAPRMTSIAGEFLAKGAAGAPVRFLFALIEKHAAKR